MHSTGNDIESNDILDFSDNCENFDVLLNADQEYWTDRLGNKRPTVDYALRMAGFTPAGFDFATGGVLKNADRNKCVFNQADQTWYSWSGDLPYNVIAGSVPGEGWKVVNRNDTVIARAAFKLACVENGLNLVDGSFEQGGVLNNIDDVLLKEQTGTLYSWGGSFPKTVPAGTSPASEAYILREFKTSNAVYLLAFGYGIPGNTPQENYAGLERFYSWLKLQSSVGRIIHPPYTVDIKTTVTANNTKFLGSDITSLSSFIFDFNGGKMNDLTDVSLANAQHVLFVIRNAAVVSFENANISGDMELPTSVRGGMTLSRVYNSGYVSFEGRAAGIINHVETRDCGTVKIIADCEGVRYPFLVYRCKSFNVVLNNKNCWRDYFIQGAESGNFHIVSDGPRQHSMIKSYDGAMINSNIVGYYKARNRTYGLETPTGQFGFEIESDIGVLFRNIHITVDIEGNYSRPIMFRNFKADGSDQTVAKGHTLQNVKISGRIKDLSGVTGNLFLVGGGYRAGDYIQSFTFEDLTVNGSFVINVDQLLPAIDVGSKMKWTNFTITDGFLQTHVSGFYANYIVVRNVTFVNKAYSVNNSLSCGILEYSKKYVGDIAAGIPLFNVDNTKTINHIVIDYCATISESTFNPFIEGRLSGILVFPTNGVISETTVDTQYAKIGTAGVADLFEISPGVLGIKIPTWTAPLAMLQVRVMIKYNSYGEGDFSSIPGMVYFPYAIL